MMMSSCQMNSSMMNNVPNTHNAPAKVDNNQVKPGQTTPLQSDVAVLASIGSGTQTASASAEVGKVYNPAGTVTPQTNGLNLNQLA